MTNINDTHDPHLRSWVQTANDAGTAFPIQNLPFGVFGRAGENLRCGVAIGDQVVDLAAVTSAGVFSGLAAKAAAAGAQPGLNALMALGPESWSALRRTLSLVLREGATERQALASCLVAQRACIFALPAKVGDYTDFYTSIHHATNVGRLFRPDNPLMPNYQWLPVAYHGRASSLVVSGCDVRRPRGQVLEPGAQTPSVRPSRRLDYELEMGVLIGVGNEMGEPIDVDVAEQHVFGLCLLNDWSARDIQAWEYQPLGPFLSKNFATSLSPWVVTMEALAPFRVQQSRPSEAPALLDYLNNSEPSNAHAISIELHASIESNAMRQSGQAPLNVTRTNFSYAFWTISQMVAHHTVNGCRMRPGDVLGTGTMSGPEPHMAAALIELTHGGKQPLILPGGETRTFLEDGDVVRMTGHCEKAGFARIGFGECTGRILPANN